MNDPDLYAKNKNMQVKDTLYLLDKYFRLVKLQPQGLDEILDVGCGDGEVSVEMLLTRFPKKAQKLVGCDISDKMVEFARKRYEQNRQVSFVKLDISTKTFPKHLEHRFHHVFSFYCLHWVADQKQTMKNIYNSLRPGGDFSVTIISSNPLYKLYEELVKSQKWTKYLPDFQNFLSPYYDKQDPVKDLESLLKSTGFSVPVCTEIERSFAFNNVHDMKNSLFAISPFTNRIPENGIEDFWNDILQTVKKTKLLVENNNDDEKCTIQYSLLFAFAIKPFK